MLGPRQRPPVRGAGVGCTVRQKLDESVRTVATLAHGRPVLLPDQFHVRRVERRIHQPVGHDGPRRVERGGRRPHAERGPVGRGIHDDRGAEPRHRPPEPVAAVVPRPALGHVEQERLDARVVVRHLPESAKQVHVGGHDVVGRDAADDHRNPVHDDAARGGVGCRGGRGVCGAGRGECGRQGQGSDHWTPPVRSASVRLIACRSAGESSTPVTCGLPTMYVCAYAARSGGSGWPCCRRSPGSTRDLATLHQNPSCVRTPTRARARVPCRPRAAAFTSASSRPVK